MSKFTLQEIAETMPKGGDIVSMIEFNGMVVIATKKHIFKGSFEDDVFKQCTFLHVEEKTDDQ